MQTATSKELWQTDSTNSKVHLARKMVAAIAGSDVSCAVYEVVFLSNDKTIFAPTCECFANFPHFFLVLKLIPPLFVSFTCKKMEQTIKTNEIVFTQLKMQQTRVQIEVTTATTKQFFK